MLRWTISSLWIIVKPKQSFFSPIHHKNPEGGWGVLLISSVGWSKAYFGFVIIDSGISLGRKILWRDIVFKTIWSFVVMPTSFNRVVLFCKRTLLSVVIGLNFSLRRGYCYMIPRKNGLRERSLTIGVGGRTGKFWRAATFWAPI